MSFGIDYVSEREISTVGMKTTARATVTIEIDEVGGTWGPECTVGQVRMQATEAVHEMIRNHLAKNSVRIIGKPEITFILLKEDK